MASRLDPGKRKRKSENGVLSARPCTHVNPIAAGLHRLALSKGRDGVLMVPQAARKSRNAPLILCLHGAGATGHDAIQPFRLHAERLGIILLAPDSRAKSWDAIKSGWGPDVDFIDLALQHALERCAVDRGSIAISGFSDGASYALSLGLGNGDLFTHIIAFSPGFMRGTDRRGTPRVFVSHGSGDLVLPSPRCSHRVVSRLKREGYEVQFAEFEGGHTVPASVASQAIDWFLRRKENPVALERHL